MRLWRPEGRVWESDPPPGLVLRLVEVKHHLRVDHSDEDELLVRLSESAVSQVERRTQRLLAARECRLRLPEWPPSGAPVALPGGVVQEIDSVVGSTDSGTVTIDPELYAFAGNAPARLQFDIDASLPNLKKAMFPVTVTYTAGYALPDGAEGHVGDYVPADLRSAALLIVAEMFDRRHEAADQRLAEAPLNAKWLMEPWRIWAS